MASNLDFLFKPRSVALIGASPDPLKWGNWMAKRLLESQYEGDLYLVNPKGTVVYGRQTFKSISEIEKPVDLAIIGIPASYVPGVVRECVDKAVKGIVIVTAGFGEMGEAGKSVERELLKMAREKSTRIVGPNCIGVYNAEIDLNTTIFELPSGPIAFLAQSGNFAMDVNYHVRRRGFGYSKWVSYGNQIDIATYEYLDYIKDDPEIKVILMYLEGLNRGTVGDGIDFLRVATETTRNTPILAIKVGSSPAGSRSAFSHTGSIAGSYEVFDAAFRQAGIIRLTNSSELLDCAEAFMKCPLPNGNKIAILTDGGGHGVMGCDAAERYGLQVPILSEETQGRLSEILPPQASTKNPVDFAGGAEADLWNFVRCSEILLQDNDIDGLVIVGQYGGYGIDLAAEFSELEEAVSVEITELAPKYDKPIINHTMYQPDQPESLRILSQGGVPVYPFVETAMRCMGALSEYSAYLEKVEVEEHEVKVSLPLDRIDKIKKIHMGAKNTGRVSLIETEARSILEAYGLPLLESQFADNEAKVFAIAEEMGYPLAMKVVSPDIIHKSDVGGVRLNLQNKDDVARAYSEIIKLGGSTKEGASIDGVLISPMIDSGIETIIGITTDETFGPTIMFGLGGIFVEVLRDVSLRVVPLSKRDVYDMIKEIRGFPILRGIRGKKPVCIDALADIILKVSALAMENPEIREMDLNPVFALENSAFIADVRIAIS